MYNDTAANAIADNSNRNKENLVGHWHKVPFVYVMSKLCFSAMKKTVCILLGHTLRIL